MPITPDLTTCNLALAQVPSAPISSLNENSLAAREVTRVYGQVLGEMLERYHWRFATLRQSLAITTNDRPLEWRTAFSLPSDVATVQSIRPDLSGQPSGYTLLAGQTLAAVLINGVDPTVFPLFPSDGYVIADGILYANLMSAVVEYTTSNVQPGQFPSLFRYALAMEIAARVVMPVFKSRERQGDLIKASQVAWDRAVAQDMGQAPSASMDFVPHDVLARFGGLC